MKYIEHTVIEHLCEDCETLLGDHDGNPYCIDDSGNYFCPDCGLRRKLIDADEWLSIHGIMIYDHAIYKNGNIIAYQKWGKGFRKDVIKVFDSDENKSRK